MVNLEFLALFSQDGDPPVSLALKRTLEVARFIWVLDFVYLFRVCYNIFVPVSVYKFQFFCVVALTSFILNF